MKLVDLKENLNTIVSLVENAEEFVVLISPFNDFEGWNRLRDAINNATETGVDIKYYVRKGEGYNGMEGLKVNLFEVPALHAKMYCSEKETYISSGNLTNDTNINWYIKLDTQEEVSQLVNEFYKKQILPVAVPYPR